jgi:mono/diheme cytochrome c family protein
MRHTTAHRATFVIAAIIVAVSALFAWIRSHDIVIAPRRTFAAPQETSAVDLSRGDAFYANNCRMCHGTLPHLGKLAAAGGGREYFADLMVFGLDGKIEIAGRLKEVFHPPFDGESDDDLAAVINYMLANWGNAASLPENWKPMEPREVAASRTRGLSGEEVASKRRSLTEK